MTTEELLAFEQGQREERAAVVAFAEAERVRIRDDAGFEDYADLARRIEDGQHVGGVKS